MLPQSMRPPHSPNYRTGRIFNVHAASTNAQTVSLKVRFITEYNRPIGRHSNFIPISQIRSSFETHRRQNQIKHRQLLKQCLHVLWFLRFSSLRNDDIGQSDLTVLPWKAMFKLLVAKESLPVFFEEMKRPKVLFSFFFFSFWSFVWCVFVASPVRFQASFWMVKELTGGGRRLSPIRRNGKFKQSDLSSPAFAHSQCKSQ